MSPTRRAFQWLVAEWPGAAILTGCFLLAVLPLWWATAGPVLGLILAQLVIYLFHQGEEHIGDRFRRFVNTNIAGGREALSPEATFWINSIEIWLFDLVALWLAATIAPGYGLIAIYITLVNGVVHILAGIALRAYNPGLISAIVLFLPIGGWALATVSAPWQYHILAAAIAILGHIVIIVHVRQRIAAIDAGSR